MVKKSKKKSNSFAWKKPLIVLSALIVLVILVVLAVKYMPDSVAGQASSTRGVSDFTRCTKDTSCNTAYTKCVGAVRNCVKTPSCSANCLSSALKLTIDRCVSKPATCASAGVSCSNGKATTLAKITCAAGQTCTKGVCIAPPSICGNGIVEKGEECEGNVACIGCIKYKCVDSDCPNGQTNCSGVNLSVKGSIQIVKLHSNLASGQMYSPEYDYCQKTNYGDYISDEKAVTEMYCDDNSQVRIETFDCPTNTTCQDGVCKPKWCDSIEGSGVKMGNNITGSSCAQRIIQKYNSSTVDLFYYHQNDDCLAVYRGVPILFSGGGYVVVSVSTSGITVVGLEPCISQKGKTLEGAKACVDERIKASGMSFYDPLCG